MKKLQGSLIAKVCVWIVLIAAAFGAGVFGVRTVLSAQAVFDDSWQYSGRYYNALEDRRRELVDGVELTQRLRELEAQIEAGTANASTQADAEALQKNWEAVSQRFSQQNTWFRFRLMLAETGEVLGTNLEEGESLLRTVQDVRRFTFELTENGGDWIASPYGGYYGYDDYSGYGDYDLQDEVEQNAGKSMRLVLEYGVPEGVNASVQDEFYWTWQAYEQDRTEFDQHLTGFLNLGVLTLFALIWVLWTAGHRAGEEKIVLNWQDKIFLDVYAVVVAVAEVFLVFTVLWAVETVWRYSNQQFYWRMRTDAGSPELYSPLGIMGAAALFACGVLAGALLLRTFAVRLKAGCLGRSTLLCRVWGWTVRTVHEFVQSLPITWKAVAGCGSYVLGSYLLARMGLYDGWLMMIYWIVQLAVLFFLAWWTYSYHRLRQGTKTIAKGDLEHQIDARRMPYDLRLQAEDLNNISVGLSTAVDEKMRSERFKAELITNVSHDLKTPLTSIINYVDLLRSTQQTDPKAIDYIEVLDRKSQRLKKLTEDLVEASKASTGALSVVREKIGMSQLIDQALGEWEEKLSDRKLTLVRTLPEGETWVYADGRHLWRVIDNLLSNCAKYAMEGTRIYLDLERGKGQVVLSVKNISREPLNVPAERLMERFVRGEESRSTEGSGLGLSIARSLTELQGGSFELAVDGDLFKAIVTLPQAS